MAFQAGTQIDPRLAIADYSGFARAGEIEGAGMAQMGQAIGTNLKQYKEDKKQEKKDQAKINRAISFGESMIDVIGEDDPMANAIANQLAMNFGADVPFEQKAAAADGLTQEITKMYLLQQQTAPLTYTMTPGGTELAMRGGEVVSTTRPYQMQSGQYPLFSTGMGTPALPGTPSLADLEAARAAGQ
jgi:hypothetical protein